ncbi:M48 family metallopeptidase [Geomonas sp. RF6]|uniref:M48 family metallopeptidase n=1 Tax=Geomonas sp. RF6 TaxID=2897342 RepID=UPI001E3F5537|nr:M48 family metallopeptidase [Geomonas sp. RF6]UFS68590.1 M48 family metallopeptidase [Geomonas sp. RF6]
MSTVRGIYFDGKSAARHSVTVERVGAEVRFAGAGVEASCAVAEIKVAPTIPGVRRSLLLPGGALCQLATDAEVERVLGEKKEGRFWSVLVRWERSIPLAIVALLLTSLMVAGFIKTVIPALVKQVAWAVKPDAEEGVGKEALAQLDHMYLKPSRLSKSRRREITGILGRVAARNADGRKYRLEFRNGGAIGANAFALPGGTIVITDAMVALARSDEELAAVLAHESGHIRYRHALRQLLQSSGAGVVIAAVTGDITSVTSLAATLPATLISAGYSREFEYEADDAAVAYLKSEGVRPRVYAEILGRLSSAAKKEEDPPISLDILNSHPSTPDRITRVLSAENPAERAK